MNKKLTDALAAKGITAKVCHIDGYTLRSSRGGSITKVVDKITEEVNTKFSSAKKEHKDFIIKSKKYLDKIKLDDGSDLEDKTTFYISKKGKVKTKRDEYKRNNVSEFKNKI